MSDWSGYSTKDTPASIRERRMWEISQGAKRGSLLGLIEKLTGGPGGGDSGGPQGRPPERDNRTRMWYATDIAGDLGVEPNPGQEPFVGVKEGPENAPPGTPGYGRSSEEHPYAQRGMNEVPGLFGRREEHQQMQNFIDWAERVPEDVRRAVDEYVDANPSVTKALQQAADNGDYRRFYQEYTDLVSALGLGGR